MTAPAQHDAEPRRPKFRVWAYGRMHYPPHTFVLTGDGRCIETYGHDPAGMGAHAGEPLRFTGYLDAEGREMYEGDIVDIGDDWPGESYYGVIEWVFAGFQLVTYAKPGANVRGTQHEANQGYLEYYDGERTEYRVIGNLYEHPHLLGAEAPTDA